MLGLSLARLAWVCIWTPVCSLMVLALEFSGERSMPALTQSLYLITLAALCPLVRATSWSIALWTCKSKQHTSSYNLFRATVITCPRWMGLYHALKYSEMNYVKRVQKQHYYLNANHNALLLDELWERDALVWFLIQCLVEENDSSYVLRNGGINGEQEVSEEAAVLLRVLHVDLLQTLCHGAWIRNENTWLYKSNVNILYYITVECTNPLPLYSCACFNKCCIYSKYIYI